MVAYSFQKRFIEPIEAGLKQQTIRNQRKGGARPGSVLQLYTGMRTKHCALIGTAIARSVRAVVLDLGGSAIFDPEGLETVSDPCGLDAFAIRDGFRSWIELQAFWNVYHPGVRTFDGALIVWGDSFVRAPQRESNEGKDPNDGNSHFEG